MEWYRLREPLQGVSKVGDKMQVVTVPTGTTLIIQGHMLAFGMVDAIWQTSTVTVLVQDLKARAELIGSTGTS